MTNRVLITKMVRVLVLILLQTSLSPEARAQEIMKHPRVVELEDSIKVSASDRIKARFPSIPFIVTVRVDPLRREGGKLTGGDASTLPYFDIGEDEEIRDEWDNPDVPLQALINRVRRIQIAISVPAKLKETEINELKEGLLIDLHLTPARDDITISRKDWVTDEVPWYGLYIVGSVLFALLLGMLFINRTAANKIARALSEINLKSAQGGGSSGSLAPSASAGDNGSDLSQRSSNQELKFNDPMKMKEMASRHIESLVASGQFPTHQDVFALDRLGTESPEKLGAVLSEFPGEMQRALFAYGSGFHWIEALHSPGFLDFDCLEVIQTLVQNPRETDDLAWDRAVLAVWRLGAQRTKFLAALSKDEAFALLYDMPKAIAVSEARKLFPGSWASIIDPDSGKTKLDGKRVAEIHESARQACPFNDIAMVRRYRAEKELLDYLTTTDPAEERDIYGASPESSLIHTFRPPFFLVFDQPPEVLEKLVARVQLDQWALALFNLPKSDRSKVDGLLNEKQKFLLVERLKKFDANPPDRRQIGAMRERVAAILQAQLEETANITALNLNRAASAEKDPSEESSATAA